PSLPNRVAGGPVCRRAGKRVSEWGCRMHLSPVITPPPEDQLAQARPFTSSQFKSCCRQRISACIFFIVETTQSKPIGHTSFKITDRARTPQFSAKQFRKNLEMAGPINESRAWRSNHRQANRHGITISD